MNVCWSILCNRHLLRSSAPTRAGYALAMELCTMVKDILEDDLVMVMNEPFRRRRTMVTKPRRCRVRLRATQTIWVAILLGTTTSIASARPPAERAFHSVRHSHCEQ